MQFVGLWTLFIALAMGLFSNFSTWSERPTVPSAPKPEGIEWQQSGGLAMTVPANCPAGGCAAGQTLHFRLDYGLADYDPNQSPNVKVCLYAPNGWVANPSDVRVSGSGRISGAPYTQSNCDEDTNKPDGYSLIAAQEAAFTNKVFGDSLEYGFRIAPGASGSGSVLARVFERQAGGWLRTSSNFIPAITIVPPASLAYVAAAPGECGGASPCYVNSADDLDRGFGTGLKDAVDAAAPGAVIRVLGVYTVKSKTVVIDRPVTIEGQGDASLTYTGPDECGSMGALLSLNHGVTLRGLNINDGTCSDDRHLVEVNKDPAATDTAPVTIESNDLTGGDNAILIHETTGPITVRYNHISRNSGFAIYWDSQNPAAMEVVANNLHDNRSGGTVECGVGAAGAIGNRVVNHNYWGGNSPAAAALHCTSDPAKRLFAPIIRKADLPGVNALQAVVQEAEQGFFSNQVFLKRTGGQDNFPLYLVDHGYPLQEAMPYTRELLNSPNPCSNLYDIFLPSGTTASGTLELSIKYDKNLTCQTVIDSASYCGQTSIKSRYPMYWANPSASPMVGAWSTTGSVQGSVSGQETECSVQDDRIKVLIDDTGRPGLNSDMNYTPFMVGVPILKELETLALDQRVRVTWQTNYEPDLAGFYVFRGQSMNDMVQLNSTMITSLGDTNFGYYYNSFIDDGRQNGTEYFYQLKIVRKDGLAFYSNIDSVIANVPTITFTPTVTLTRTRAPTSTTYVWPTSTPSPTRIPTLQPTRIPTLTPLAATRTPTRTLIVLNTRTPTLDPFFAATLSGTPGLSTPEELSATLTITPQVTITPTRRVTRTPAVTLARTVVSPVNSSQSAPWLSLLLGLLAGTGVVGGAGYWWYMRLRQ